MSRLRFRVNLRTELLENFYELNCLRNPQKGMQSFDALMKLQEKIDKSSSEQK